MEIWNIKLVKFYNKMYVRGQGLAPEISSFVKNWYIKEFHILLNSTW